MPTITEALSDLKIIDSRVNKKLKVVADNLARFEQIVDPFARTVGGSKAVIASELQAISDLGEYKVQVLRAIRTANEATEITVNGVTRTIQDWLTWRREVAPKRREMLNNLYGAIQSAREQAKKQGKVVVTATSETPSATNIIVNVDELALTKDIEDIDTILGLLDGQLSMKNATTPVTI